MRQQNAIHALNLLFDYFIWPFLAVKYCLVMREESLWHLQTLRVMKQGS